MGDEDRATVVDLLRAHTADGHLTLDEFSERVGVALAAETRSDLDRVTADLPGIPAPAPGQVATRRRRVSRWVVAVLGGNGRKGRWRTGSQVTAIAVMGGCDIDFRHAEFESDEIIVTAVAIMGGINIVVPEGIAVELTGFPIMGGKNIKVADVPILPGSPRIVIRAFPVMGGVDVRSKPNRTAREALRDTASSIWREMAAADEPAAALPGVVADLHEGILRRVSEANEKMAREQAKIERRAQRAVQHGQHGQHRAYRDDQDPDERPAGPGRGRPVPDRRGRARGLERIQADIDRHLGPGASEKLAEVVGPAVASYGRRWGIQLERGEDKNLPADTELDSVPAAPDGTVTILFTDICGYTELTERLGDRGAHQLVSDYQKIVRGQLASYGGYEVKVQGDGFMVAFAGASRALRCAIAIQRAMDDYSKDHGDEPIRVHQGLHTGEAVRDKGDFLGRTVILASRITGEAHESEILVSSLLMQLADGTKEFRFGEARQVALKGVAAEQTVYPVEWRPGA